MNTHSHALRAGLRRMTAIWLLALSACGATAAAAQDTKSPPPPDVADVAYGTHERHRLDLWLARSPERTPLVIFIHGGGWHGGEKSSVPPALVRAMLAEGISVASINYRFTHMAPLPAPVTDAARAVQFLRSRAAEWNLDASRFGGFGISAGACTVLWLACHDDLADPRSADAVARQSTRLAVAVGMSAQTSLEPAVIKEWIGPLVLEHPMIRRAVGVKTVAQLEEGDVKFGALLREYSAIRHVTADDPPVLLSYPTMAKLPAETTGSAIHHAVFGEKLREAATAAGMECVLRIEDRADASVPTSEKFLRAHLMPDQAVRAPATN